MLLLLLRLQSISIVSHTYRWAEKARHNVKGCKSFATVFFWYCISYRLAWFPFRSIVAWTHTKCVHRNWCVCVCVWSELREIWGMGKHYYSYINVVHAWITISQRFGGISRFLGFCDSSSGGSGGDDGYSNNNNGNTITITKSHHMCGGLTSFSYGIDKIRYMRNIHCAIFRKWYCIHISAERERARARDKHVRHVNVCACLPLRINTHHAGCREEKRIE